MARSAISAVKTATPKTRRVDQTQAGSRESATYISDYLRIGMADVQLLRSLDIPRKTHSDRLLEVLHANVRPPAPVVPRPSSV
jgi:hypothetical protein